MSIISQAQHEFHESQQLRDDNGKLRANNVWYKEALHNTTSSNCGAPIVISEMLFDEEDLRVGKIILGIVVGLANKLKC